MNQSFQELTDSQWQVIQLILNDKRKRWHSLRTIINAILWLNYTGLQWRELDKLTGNKLPWQSVYYHFRQFKLRGIWPGRRCGANSGLFSRQRAKTTATRANSKFVSP